MAEFYSARSWEIPPLPWTNLSPPFSPRKRPHSSVHPDSDQLRPGRIGRWSRRMRRLAPPCSWVRTRCWYSVDSLTNSSERSDCNQLNNNKNIYYYVSLLLKPNAMTISFMDRLMTMVANDRRPGPTPPDPRPFNLFKPSSTSALPVDAPEPGPRAHPAPPRAARIPETVPG